MTRSAMSLFRLIIHFTWALFTVSCFGVLTCVSWCPYDFVHQINQPFEQKSRRFWEFKQEEDTWVEVELPYNLVSCVDGECGKVGVILQPRESRQDEKGSEDMKKRLKQDEYGYKKGVLGEISGGVLPQRRRTSLTKMSDTSIWVTGESGRIYERFWNGLQWVIAPHDLPISRGHANAVFLVNHTILALSEAGKLYQMQLSESSQPVWVEFTPLLSQITYGDQTERNSLILIKSGVVSHDKLRAYFCTRDGMLLELIDVELPRWVNHGQPAGANVAAIADATTIREVVYTINCAGDLYEFDKLAKPSWKKHIWRQGNAQASLLLPSKGFALDGFTSDHSTSIFLLTKAGSLVERRLHKRKWKWIVHGSPNDQNLTSITPVQQDESNENSISLFFTTSTGSVVEYRITKESGIFEESWESHSHPVHTKVARGFPGLQLQFGRIVFPLDDGRLAELHLPGVGGESSGPTTPTNFRKKASMKYMWSTLDAPESEGWNAEYCTEERGPTNCITGIQDDLNDSGMAKLVTRRRKGSQSQGYYLYPDASGGERIKSSEEYKIKENWIESNFRLRLMHEGKSFFLIADVGMTFEYLYVENLWLWLRHDSSAAMKGILGNYNGSMFVVDTYHNLLIRERSFNGLEWMNFTNTRKGRHVISGPPWDGIPGKARKVTPDDAVYFVSKSGTLLQLMVFKRKFKWKDCRNPPNTKVACIVDQELLRENVVFVIGRNGRLYQYNKVNELWHEHHQSQHLILSQFPGTSSRPSSKLLAGSLFMLSEEGGLVEYQWNSWDGWNWVEHGTPSKGVTLVGSTGPCFDGNQLFLIGSDGNVYLRYMDQKLWEWNNYGFPSMESITNEDLNTNCDSKAAATRPIPLSTDTVIFELRDGRLAEMQRISDVEWVWSRVIGTPTSLCLESY